MTPPDPLSRRFGGSAVTDASGRFELDGLVAGWQYDLSLEPRPDGSIPSLGSVTAEAGRRVDMAVVSIPAPRKPYVPPTLDERIASAMNVKGSTADRFERAINRCESNNQKLLIVLGKPNDSRLRRFMELRYGDRSLGKVLQDFLVMALSSDDPERADSTIDFLESIGFDTQNEMLPFSLGVVGVDGGLIAQRSTDDIVQDAKLSKEALIQWLGSYVDPPIDAQRLLADTLSRAKAENKRVILQETATWCGPCHMLADFLEANRQWEADYLWVKMDHRFTGASEIMSNLREGAEGGIPWMAILDADGEKLATSNHFESGQNIGFPSSAQGREHFTKMLLDTRQTMTDEQLNEMIAGLKK